MKIFWLSAVFFLLLSSAAYAQKVLAVESESQADAVIFYVKYESQAGWRTEEKKHFFEGEDGSLPGPKNGLKS